MQPGLQSYGLIAMLVLASLLYSCGKSGDVARISALEERMITAQDPIEKSELANLLHREYALYHLHNEKDTLFLMRWAKMAEEGREYEQAIEIYSMLLERAPASPGVYAGRGRLHAGLGYYGEAAADYGRAGSLLPGIDSAKRREYEYLSGFYYRVDSVISRESQLIAAGNDPRGHLLNRAEQYSDCGYYSAAVADIRQVLESDSTYARAHYLMAVTYMASGDYEHGRQAFETYFSIADPADENFIKAGEQQQRLEQLVLLKTLERDLASEPYAYENLIDAAVTAFRLKKYSEAMVYATRLSESFPDSVFGYLYRGQVNIQTGNLAHALDDMDRVLELEPSNISARNLKGYVLFLRKEFGLLQQEISEIMSRGGEVLEILRPYAEDIEK